MSYPPDQESKPHRQRQEAYCRGQKYSNKWASNGPSQVLHENFVDINDSTRMSFVIRHNCTPAKTKPMPDTSFQSYRWLNSRQAILTTMFNVLNHEMTMSLQRRRTTMITAVRF
jgi:hypothetical protein